VKITRHDVLTCPVCHYEMDSSTDPLGNDTPNPGDITICIECGSVLVYGEGLRLVQTWDPEILEHPNVVRFTDAWLRLHGE